jgi:hypothetical protein
MDTKELASRGKRAESALAAYLKKTKESHASFDYQRQYDARSAGGRFQSQAGDYLVWRLKDTVPFSAVIEAKQVHHDYRLPSKNFSGEQIGKLRRRQLAGSGVLILVFHTTTGFWRCVPFKLFTDNPSVPSWDLSEYTTWDHGPAEMLRCSAPRFFDF